jgi:hypothetical protein
MFDAAIALVPSLDPLCCVVINFVVTMPVAAVVVAVVVAEHPVDMLFYQ